MDPACGGGRRPAPAAAARCRPRAWHQAVVGAAIAATRVRVGVVAARAAPTEEKTEGMNGRVGGLAPRHLRMCQPPSPPWLQAYSSRSAAGDGLTACFA